MAFAPSPEPNGHHYAEYVNEPLSPATRIASSGGMPRAGKTPSSQGKEHTFGWERIVVDKNGLRRVTEG